MHFLYAIDFIRVSRKSYKRFLVALEYERQGIWTRFRLETVNNFNAAE